MSRSSKVSLLLIFLTVFIDILGFGIVLPLLPRYARQFEATGAQLALLMASFSAMQFLFSPLWGRLSDRVGRRPILILGLLGSAICYSLFGYATTLGKTGTLLGLGVLPWLFICRIGAGIAGATIPTAAAYIADVTGQSQRARGMALIGVAFGVGFTFGPLLGAFFVSADVGDSATLQQPEVRQLLALSTSQVTRMTDIISDYDTRLEAGRLTLSQYARRALRTEREQKVLSTLNTEQRAKWDRHSAPSPWPGYVAGLLSATALLCSIFLLPESLTAHSAAAGGGWSEVAHLRSVLGRPALLTLLFTGFLITFAFAQFESTLALLTEYLGLADRHNYFVFAYIGVVLSLSQGFLVRRLLPRLGENVLCIAGTILMTAGLLLVGLSVEQESRWLMYCVLPITVVGFSALNPSLQGLLSRESGAGEQGGIMGLSQSASALARILGPLVGLMLNSVNVTYPYWCGAALMAVGIILTMLLRKPQDAGAVAVPA